MVVAQDVVVIGVGEFVQGEVGHAHRVLFEFRDVGILDGFRKLNREAVGFEPARTRMVTGAAVSVFGGGEPMGHFFHVVDSGSRDTINDILELVTEKVQGEFGFFGMILLKILMHEDGPAFVFFSGVSFRRRELGMLGREKIGRESVAIGDERPGLFLIELREEVLV